MQIKQINNWDQLPLMIDVDTLALILGCTPATITRWTREGRLQSVQINRRHMYAREYIRHLLTFKEAEYES